MIDKPDYEAAAKLAAELMEKFEKGEIDRVELIYNHFKYIDSDRYPGTLPAGRDARSGTEQRQLSSRLHR